MAGRNNFDVTEICRMFRERKLGATHVDLFNELRRLCVHNKEWKLALAEIGGECLRQNKQPVDALGLTLLYGMELGVLLERNRRSKGELIDLENRQDVHRA